MEINQLLTGQISTATQNDPLSGAGKPVAPSSAGDSRTTPVFQVGDTVFYGIHGRCKIAGIEERSIGGSVLHFFRLVPIRAAPLRVGRQESAIWMPVASAAQSGLRTPLQEVELDRIYALLSNEECALPLRTPWPKIQPLAEAILRNDGPVGLAKVEGYLFLARQRELAPAKGMIRFAETVHRLLVREIQAITQESPKTIDGRLERLLISKLRFEA
ncbi:MAG: hypothetical protein IT285_01935 [Bdellovibrionales bacterium]|nr:hypothetical protein [Bdellovibrionales bacterium]